jgi:Spy/CpxP family protein refolding chaperone
MTKKLQSPTVIAIGILLLVLATTLAVSAPQGQRGYGQGPRGMGPGGPGDGGAMMGIFRDLDLSDDQRDQLRTIGREQMEGELGDLTRAQIQARRNLRQLIHDPAADENAIVDAVRAQTVTEEQLALARHRLFVAMFGVLTEEQQAKALQLIEERADEDFRPPHRGRRGGPPSGQ